jgi:transcriptional regulator with XRE-family HTH domain
MSVGERIREAREKKGVSQAALAKEMGVSRATVWGWETGEILQIRTEKIPKLAAFLDIPTSALTPFGGGGVTPLEKDHKTRFVPLLQWSDLKHIVGGKMKLSALKRPKYIEVDLEVPPDCIFLRIEDDANAPEFEPPDLILINQRLADKVEADDYVLVRVTRTGEELFRAYTPRGGGAYDLVPDNPNWKTVTINKSNPGEIIGVLAEHRQKRRKKRRR